MKANRSEKILSFDQSSSLNKKQQVKYNQPVDTKGSSLQIGIQKYLSKLNKIRTDKFHDNRSKIQNYFKLSKIIIT